MSICPCCGQDMPLELIQNPVQALLKAYCDLFKIRYKTNPIIRGVDAGTAKRLIKDMGPVKAQSLLEAYFRMNDAWFIQKRHDLKIFEQSLNQVSVFHDTNTHVTRQQAQQTENRQTNVNAFAKMLNHDDEK